MQQVIITSADEASCPLYWAADPRRFHPPSIRGSCTSRGYEAQRRIAVPHSCPPPPSLCIFSVALAHSFLSSFYLFYRIITSLRSASGPMSVGEPQLRFPGQWYQGRPGTAVPRPLRQMPPLLPSVLVINQSDSLSPELLLAVVPSPDREIPSTASPQEAKPLTPKQNKVTR